MHTCSKNCYKKGKFHAARLVTDVVDKVQRNVYAQERDLEKREEIKGSKMADAH